MAGIAAEAAVRRVAVQRNALAIAVHIILFADGLANAQNTSGL